MEQIRTIMIDGLWRNNPAFVQLLGLCPTMAVTTSAVNGLSLGLATTFVVIASSMMVAVIRNWVTPEIRVSAYMLIIAGFTTIVDLAMHAFFYDLHKVLGIFIPLIVTNCFVLGRAEAFASKNTLIHSGIDALAMGLGFTSALIVLGALRELLGKGTILADLDRLLGTTGEMLSIQLFQNFDGFILMILPPGAFIGLGLLVALKNFFEERQKKQTEAMQERGEKTVVDTI